MATKNFTGNQSRPEPQQGKSRHDILIEFHRYILAQLGQNKYEFVRVEDFATMVRIWRDISNRSVDC